MKKYMAILPWISSVPISFTPNVGYEKDFPSLPVCPTYDCAPTIVDHTTIDNGCFFYKEQCFLSHHSDQPTSCQGKMKVDIPSSTKDPRRL